VITKDPCFPPAERIKRHRYRDRNVDPHHADLDLVRKFVTPDEIVAFAERELEGRQFDLLFVSCTNFRAVEARPLLMQRFAVPVVTSYQATIDAVFDAIGVLANWPLAAA
jgi:maleate cis-trans isomerase